jgi:hypothetical protein
VYYQRERSPLIVEKNQEETGIVTVTVMVVMIEMTLDYCVPSEMVVKVVVLFVMMFAAVLLCVVSAFEARLVNGAVIAAAAAAAAPWETKSGPSWGFSNEVT